jgi:tetratricopeptide (TPR) repeat protein
LAKEAFDLWQAGDLEAAVPKYIEALELADPAHYALADYLGEFGSVLAALERNDEALTQFSRALKHALLDDPEGEHAGIGVATYFLAEHLMKMQRFAEALETLQTSPALTRRTEWLLRFVEARALWRLSRSKEAKVSAARAIACAPSKEKSAELASQLAEILSVEAM